MQSCLFSRILHLSKLAQTFVMLFFLGRQENLRRGEGLIKRQMARLIFLVSTSH
jgi:hypothetical protein